MAVFRAFRAFRPKKEFSLQVAAKPYDVLNSDEARIEVKDNPLSFLHVGKPEVDLDPGIHLYDARVYAKAKENLEKLIRDRILIQDDEPCLYVYAQTMKERTQFGLVGCASVEDYQNDTIKKHEKTRKDKEEDRAQHVRITRSHSGPIFLTYPDHTEINRIIENVCRQEPENDFVTPDGIRHRTWVIRDKNQSVKLSGILSTVPCFYVADGHHRSAAAAIVGKELKKANPAHRGDEEYNYFLSVLFPASQLFIMDYNRVIKDLNELTEEELLERLKKAKFQIRESRTPIRPGKKGEFGMFLKDRWLVLNADPSLLQNKDPVENLDVSILQKLVLDPIFGIKDPRTDKRIDFVGGIRGLTELEKRVNSGEMKAAFSLYPTSVEELMKIADAGQIMPPKSTWFEPKLRDGLFVHFF